MFPDDVAERIFAGINPVRAWREHFMLTVNELASRAGMPPATLQRCESRKRLTEDEAEAIADALGIDRCWLQRYRGEFASCGAALDGIDVEAIESAP